jgi:hypothetical protein
VAFPKNTDELREQGYLPDGISTCSCGAKMHWYRTPKGKRMPMTVHEDGSAVSHFSDCPKASNFRKAKQ